MLRTKVSETIEHQIPLVPSRKNSFLMKIIDFEASIDFPKQPEAIFLRKLGHSRRKSQSSAHRSERKLSGIAQAL